MRRKVDDPMARNLQIGSGGGLRGHSLSESS